jgi:hypothetical protein
VEDRIKSHEESLAGADPDEKSGVEPVGILPKMMEIPVLLPAIFELKTVFVTGSIARETLIRKEGVDEHTHPFASRGLESDAERRMASVRAVNDAASRCCERFVDEGKKRLAGPSAGTSLE